jgi:hypothetical protein
MSIIDYSPNEMAVAFEPIILRFWMFLVTTSSAHKEGNGELIQEIPKVVLKVPIIRP